MVEYLKDLQIRNILTKPELGLVGVFLLGDQIFQVLGKLSQEGRVRGAYFTHYYDPPRTEPHVKVGIRYDNLADLESASSVLDSLCDKHKDVVLDRGKFEPTTGEFPNLPSEIVVDYIFCHSFEFLLKVKEELGNELPPYDCMAEFIVRHAQEITNQAIEARDIFRYDQNARPLTPVETGWVWERFVHDLLNAYKAPYDPYNPAQSYELKVKRILVENGICIF